MLGDASIQLADGPNTVWLFRLRVLFDVYNTGNAVVFGENVSLTFTCE